MESSETKSYEVKSHCMATVQITTSITLEQFLDAAAQLSSPELEQLADSIGQLLADRVGARMTTHQTEPSQVSAINPLGQLSTVNPSERMGELGVSESNIHQSDMSEPDNGDFLPGVTLPIVKTLIPDSLTLDGDSLDL